jgi:hypothetical protein
MSDERTPEQVAADNQFEEAIHAFLTAYDATDGPVIEWMLLTAQHLVNDDGTTSTAVGHWVPPGQAYHRSMGLLDYMQTRLRAVVAGNADLDEGR